MLSFLRPFVALLCFAFFALVACSDVYYVPVRVVSGSRLSARGSAWV